MGKVVGKVLTALNSQVRPSRGSIHFSCAHCRLCPETRYQKLGQEVGQEQMGMVPASALWSFPTSIKVRPAPLCESTLLKNRKGLRVILPAQT